METFFESSCKITERLVDKSAIALGFFDGVHPGHKAVIQQAIDDANRLGVKSGVVTFKDHPRSLTRGKSPMLLTVIEKRLELMKDLGVDFALVLSFTEELCQLSPREYVENVLIGATGAKSISVGHNHHFGRDREGDADLLREMGLDLDFTVNVAKMVKLNNKEVSSSRIRELIEQGDMHTASSLLLRPFSVTGKVIHGDGRGKAIGFPTANLEVFEFQMLPKRGVYAGYAISKEQDGSKEEKRYGCVINVGKRPTFDTSNEMTIEAHLFNCSDNLYDSHLEIEFLTYIREEKKFDGKDSLVSQIELDKQTAINFIESKEAKEEKLHA